MSVQHAFLSDDHTCTAGQRALFMMQGLRLQGRGQPGCQGKLPSRNKAGNELHYSVQAGPASQTQGWPSGADQEFCLQGLRLDGTGWPACLGMLPRKEHAVEQQQALGVIEATGSASTAVLTGCFACRDCVWMAQGGLPAWACCPPGTTQLRSSRPGRSRATSWAEHQKSDSDMCLQGLRLHGTVRPACLGVLPSRDHAVEQQQAWA